MTDALSIPHEVWVWSTLWLRLEIRTPSGSSLIISLTGVIGHSTLVEFSKLYKYLLVLGRVLNAGKKVEVGMEDTYLWIIYQDVPFLALSTLVSFLKQFCNLTLIQEHFLKSKQS